MDFDSFDLSRKEVRRLKKIAAGDKVAQRSEEEKALLRFGLIEEKSLIILTNGQRPQASTDAVVVTRAGKQFLAYWNRKQKEARKDSFRFWFPTLIAILSLLVSLISILQPVLH